MSPDLSYPVTKPEIHVVGAVIVRDGKVLAAKRAAHKTLGSYWEFPGGKIEDGESPHQALTRELNEELQCAVEIGPQVDFTRYEYEFAVVNLTTFLCTLVDGEPRNTEHEELRWVPMSELSTLRWAAADVPAIEKLMR